ncbi:Fe-S cluster assembly protein SufD [Ferruginibacter albus]|uniref:Fe-S cluster assembly protein SufD n=1 Tax=Ferruginibacter albus TaxID=2875540 RepID=UPI001CC72E99|nr:Fe-S cluster assembly protein SufD [Ferruginibacter albus]UAY50812.1 Fe-S cluster assembly protein SufD [Ferruginibacter albus]
MDNTAIQTSLYGQLVEHIEERSQQWALEGKLVSSLRENAFTQFKKLGFPTTKVEDWKFTNVHNFLKDEFVVENYDATAINKKIIKNISGLDCYTIVLHNGKYISKLSDEMPSVVALHPIHEAKNFAGFSDHFGKHINITDNHFAALNTSLYKDGLFIEIRKNVIVDKPLHFVHVSSSDKNILIHPRNLIVVDANAEVSIVESYVTEGDGIVFYNAVSEIVVDANAKVNHYNIQTGNNKVRLVQQVEVNQKSSSLYNNYKASFPGIDLLRNNTNVALDGKNVESHLFGLYLSGGQQLVDNHTVVDHREPNCFSNELYKGVMKDEAKSVFNGKVFVRKDAQKTNAFQQNNNLMLSKKAVVDSKPQLEIFADDVKCSHGSTIGQFDEDALFYLRSRGIADNKARALLVQAFAYDVTEKFAIPAIRAHVDNLIETALNEA